VSFVRYKHVGRNIKNINIYIDIVGVVYIYVFIKDRRITHEFKSRINYTRDREPIVFKFNLATQCRSLRMSSITYDIEQQQNVW